MLEINQLTSLTDARINQGKKGRNIDSRNFSYHPKELK